MLSPARIVQQVEEYYHIAPGVIFDSCRTKTVAEARQLAVYICKKHTTRSNAELADMFYRDAKTIRHSVNNITKQLKNDAMMRVKYSQLAIITNKGVW